MVNSKTRAILFCVLLALTSIVLNGCEKPEQPQTEERPKPPEQPVSPTASLTETVEVAKLAPPQPEEIEEKVRLVFGEAALADRSRRPYSFVGDFNGDDSQDLAVVLKPAPNKLDQLNGDYPRWLTRDPLSSSLPKSVIAANRPARTEDPASARGLPVLSGETLLAVIHGHGPRGWRDPEATQTFLLKNVVGDAMRTRERTEVTGVKGKRMPQIDGDVIDQRLVGQSGFIYFSLAQGSYEWYDPIHYKPEGSAGPAHGMKSKNTGANSGGRQGEGMSSKGN